MSIKVVVIESAIKAVTVSKGPAGSRGIQGLQGDLSNPVDYVIFNNAPSLPSSPNTGTMYWDADDEALAVVVNGSILQIGQEFYLRMVNKTGGTLSNGTPVSISGVQGNRPTAAPIDVASLASVRKYIGFVTDDILDNAEGLVTVLGLVRDIDTSTWVVGTELWATGNAGVLTDTEPVAGYRVRVGLVTTQHATQGVILARPIMLENTKPIADALSAANSPSSSNVFLTEDDLEHKVCLFTFIANPARNAEQNIHGGLLKLETGEDLSAAPVTATTGIGKLIIAINAGSDLAGNITITGTSVNRNTGVETPGDTSVITIDALTVDAESTDANGIIVHSLTGAYITDKWFTGLVTLTSGDTVITDLDIYHCSFEQFDDSSVIEVVSIDANVLCLSASGAKFSGYLYTVEVTDDKVDVLSAGGVVIETFTAGVMYRIRRTPTVTLNGTKDGIFISVALLGNNTFADFGHKVWVHLKD